MHTSDTDPCAPADRWEDPERVRDERAGADAPEQDTSVSVPVAEWSVPPKSTTGDTLQDVLVDVWFDARRVAVGDGRTPSNCYRTWWWDQLEYWSDHAQYKLRRGRDGHLHSLQGADIVAKVFERMAGSDSLPPRTWGAFRMYMYTAIDHACQDLGDLVRVATCAAPWERYSDSEEDGRYWSPATDDTSHDQLDADILGDLIREHTTDAERELLLYLWGGHTAASIAEATGGKREAVKRRITRLRTRLQPILVEHGYARPVEPEFHGDREPLRAHHNVPGQSSFPLCKTEGRIRLPRVDWVPRFLEGSTDVRVKTDAPVTVWSTHRVGERSLLAA